MDILESSPPPHFEEMYEQFHKLIYHIAYNLTKDVHLSQDIVQETFLKAYMKIDTLMDRRKIKAWLTSIARCTAIDFLRKQSKRNEVCIEDHEELHPLQEQNGTEETVEALFLKSSVAANIDRLPASQQEVMRLKVTSDLSDKEIALKLNLSPATVKTRFHRARKQLYSIVHRNLSA